MRSAALGDASIPGHKQQGQSLVELALVAPILLLMILGAVELGHAFNAYTGIISASREGARLAARGNIFLPSQIAQVTAQHAGGLDLSGSGAALLTTVKSDTSGFISYTTQALFGTATSRLSAADLLALQEREAGSDPAFLKKEQFVAVEVFYDHRSLTGLLYATIPMYAYTIMPVSAAS